MYKETDRVVYPLTKKLADEFAVASWAGERDMSEAHIAWLLIELEEGRFYSPTWTKAYIKTEKRWYRVDGQHSSTMLSQQKDFPKGLFVTIRKFECDTLSDLVGLHSTFDNRRSVREGKDYAKSVMATNSILAQSDISPRSAYSLASGIAVANGPDERLKLSPQGRARLINECPEFIVAAGTLLAGKHKVGMTAAMYLTWLVGDPNAWTSFWTEVLQDKGAAGSPARALCNFLKHKHGNSTEAVRMLFVKCLHAWNAFRRGATSNLNYYPTAEVPKVI